MADTPAIHDIFRVQAESLTISVRVFQTFRFGEILTLKDLVTSTPERLRSIRWHQFGKKSLGEVLALLAELGMTLSMSEADILAWDESKVVNRESFDYLIASLTPETFHAYLKEHHSELAAMLP